MNILYSVFAFVFVNIILYFGQEWYYSQDTADLIGLQNQINDQKRSYILLEVELKNIQDQSDKISDKKQFEVLKNKYDKTYNMYSRMIEEHNKNVKEYNRLTKRSGSRWYVIPVPGRTSKRSKIN